MAAITSGLREWLKQFRALVRLKIQVGELVDRARYGRERRTLAALPLFAPYSSGSSPARAAQAVLAANQTFPFLAHLLEATGDSRTPETVDAEALCADPQSRRLAEVLKRTFDTYGSDKALAHDYHYIYGHILRDASAIRSVVEIGLGSNNPDVVSNMGQHAKPGSSLRAFRDCLPNAVIVGADVDRRILFEEDRIRTVFVDQTDLESFRALEQVAGGHLDLVIDDGLHAPNANLAVAAFALPRLTQGGWLIIEDIAPNAVPVWRVVSALLPAEYRPIIINAKGAFVFGVRRGADPRLSGSAPA
jgi:hypothetical protein